MTARKRTRGPEAKKSKRSNKSSMEPPRKKMKLLSIDDSKDAEDAGHFLALYVTSTLMLTRLMDRKRFADDGDDDDDDLDMNSARSMRYVVLRPPCPSPSNAGDTGNKLISSPNWLRLSDVLSSGYKYSGRSEPTSSEARKAFTDDLKCFLKRYCIGRSLDKYLTSFRNRFYISESGFCFLTHFLRDFDSVSAHVQHMFCYRFFYRKKLFDTVIDRSYNIRKSLSINDTTLCKACGLDDLDRHFDASNPCDCACEMHTRCEAIPYTAPPPTDSPAFAAWFCVFCTSSTLSQPDLIARRAQLEQTGEFEVERVIDYDARDDEYFVQWRNYPAQAVSAIKLSSSFLEAVLEFWHRQPKGAKIPAQAQRGITALETEQKQNETPETSSEQENSSSKPVASTKESSPKPQKGDENSSCAMQQDNEEEKRSEQPLSKPESLSEHSEHDTSGAESEEVPAPATFQAQQPSKRVPKFIPAKLTDVMDEKYIIRRQKYIRSTYQRFKGTQDKYRRWLQGEVKKGVSAIANDLRVEMARSKSNRLPKYHLRSVNNDWDCDLPRIHDLIVQFLARDWASVPAEQVSSPQFVIAEILDPENPAKKYGGEQGVHEHKAYGLFAMEAIKKDTLLFEYAGCVKPVGMASRALAHLETELDQTTLFDLIGHLDADRTKLFWGKKANDQLVVDPSKWHNEGVYMNDYRDKVMDDPDDDEQDVVVDSEGQEKSVGGDRKQNVKYYEVLVNGWPRVFAVAMCDVEAGTELLSDYGDDFWRNFRVMMRRQAQLKEIKDRIEAECTARCQKECDAKVQALQKENDELRLKLGVTKQ